MLEFHLVLLRSTTEQLETPGTPLSATKNTSDDPKVRSELVNALASNHEKRREIASLRDQVKNLKCELEKKEELLKERKNNRKGSQVPPPTDNNGGSSVCQNCVELQELQEEQREEFNREFANLQQALEEAKENNKELQSNMVDMVKSMDKKKIQEAEAQNNAMLKFVDDAKEGLRVELETVHQGEIEVLFYVHQMSKCIEDVD